MKMCSHDSFGLGKIRGILRITGTRKVCRANVKSTRSDEPNRIYLRSAASASSRSFVTVQVGLRRRKHHHVSPTATHTYANTGTYTISLTVTNNSGTSTTKVFTGQTMSNNGGPTAQSSKTLTIGLLAYVPNTGSSSVTPIDLSTQTAESVVSVGNDPQGIAITPDGTMAYVANYNDNTVTPITIATNTPGTAITVGTHPQVVAITPMEPWRTSPTTAATPSRQ